VWKTATFGPNSVIVAISENEILASVKGRDQVSYLLRRDSGRQSAIAIGTSLHR
jgi:hypothetical protein